jgi:hypothetical protein
MLADRRADALINNFSGQWLFLRDVKNAKPESDDFDENLRMSLRRETEMLFESIVREDRSIVDLLNADYTFVDERLARHYGIPNIRGSHFRRVTLKADDPRRGLLGQGSLLLVTSAVNRTSPVMRGKWILENVLGVGAPAVPASVPPLKENSERTDGKVLSMRQRMEEWKSIARIRLALHVTRSWTPSASLWRTSTSPGSGGMLTRELRSTLRANSWMGPN